jgi:hypothetical protein
MDSKYLTPPKHSGELRVDLDHVWINLRGTWKRQKTVRNCSRRACWDLLTHPTYSKIHALERKEKLNSKIAKFYEFRNGEWLEILSESIG